MCVCCIFICTFISVRFVLREAGEENEKLCSAKMGLSPGEALHIVIVILDVQR